MDRDMNILYILGVPLGYVMEWIYNLIPNYGWDIIIFTIVIRLLSIPLQLNQQKSMAKMSAFQPMIADIQKKYKDKPEKQQEELLKLQQEYGYKPTAGCMPMLVNFLVMFGVIEVVYRPLQRIFHIGADAVAAAGDAMTALGISFTQVTRDTNIIAQVLAGESTVTSVFTADQLNTITEFGQHMDFFGIDLTRVPQYSLAADNLPLLIFPILAVVTMFISTHISSTPPVKTTESMPFFFRNSEMEFFINGTMSGIKAAITDHLEMFFRDVPDKAFDKIHDRNG